MFSIYKIPTFHLEERMINFERERECFVGLQYINIMSLWWAHSQAYFLWTSDGF